MSQMCAWCAQAFAPKRRTFLTCSRQCWRGRNDAQTRARRSKGKLVYEVRMCAYCAQSFISKAWNANTCSPYCYEKHVVYSRYIRRINDAAYYKRLRDADNASKKKHWPEHRAQKYAREKIRRSHPIVHEKILASGRKSKKKHYVKHRQRNLEWIARNHTRHVRTKRAWRRRNPARVHTYNHQMRLQRKPSIDIGDLTAAQVRAVLMAAKGKCYYCGKKRKLTVDHIEALAKGGAHSVQNIVAACLSCNSKKRAGSPPIPVQPYLLVEEVS